MGLILIRLRGDGGGLALVVDMGVANLCSGVHFFLYPYITNFNVDKKKFTNSNVISIENMLFIPYSTSELFS